MATPVEIAVKATGTDRAARALGQVESRASRMGRALGRAAAAGAVLAGAAIIKFGVDSVKSLARIEQINAQTTQAIKSTGGAAGVSAKHVENLAGRLENLTATEAETTQEGANLLLTFTNIRNGAGKANKIFDRSVATITDMSRALGQDTKSSAIQLGKALNDPIKGITALSRVGVSFTEQQKKTITTLVESGDTMKAQKVILAELTKEFGGSGRAFAQTTQGKIELAKHAFGTLGETIFAKLLPPLGDLAERATKAFDSLNDAAPKIERVAGELWDALEPAVSAIIGLFDDLVPSGEDAGSMLEDKLIPAVQILSDLVAGAVGVIDGLPGPVKDFGVQAGITALVLPKLTGALTSAKASAGGFVGSLRNAETRAAKLRSAAGTLAGVGGLALLVDASNDAEGAMKELKDTAGKTALAFAVGGPWAAAATAFVDIIGSAQGAGEDFGLSQDEMRVQIDKVTESLNRQTGAFTKRTRNQLIADLGDKGLLQTANDMNIALPKLVNATMQGTQGIQAFREKYLSSLPDNQRAKFIDLTETLFDMSDALLTGQRGFILEREAAGKSGKVIQAVREKVRDLANQYFILPRQVNTIVKAVGADNSRQNVRELARQYGLTPKEIRTIFKTGNIEAVRHDLKNVQDGAKNTRRGLEDVGNARANVNQWVKDVFGGTQDARHKAQQGSQDVADSLKGPVEKARANLDPFSADLGSGINRLTGQARSGGTGIGSALKSGVVAGFAGAATQLATDASNAVTAAVQSARRAADAHSPSRKMRKVGRDMVDGLILGFDDGSAGVAKVSERLANLIATTYARRAKAARKRIDNAKKERQALRALEHAEKRRAKQLRHLDDALVKNGRRQDENNRKLDAARGKLRGLVSTAKDYAGSIRDAVVATGDVTTLGKDEAGTATIGGILDQMRDRVAAAQRYADLIRRLTKAGLNKTSLRQLLAAGVEGGLSTAEALVAGGPNAVRQVNRLTGQLNEAGTGMGDKAAKTMYGAGIKAAQGLVDGLESKQKHLDRVARRMARTLANAVRKALGIKSPSKVFRDLGAQTVAGLTIGLDETHVRASGRKLAGSLVDGFADPKLTARVAFDQMTAAGTAAGQPIVVQLSAEELSAIEQGRRIQIKLDAYSAAGGRRRS